MKSIIVILTAGFFLIGNNLKAQTPKWLWAHSFEGKNTEVGHKICTDNMGNVIVVGTFLSDTITIGTTILTKTNTDPFIFIAKYDKAGNVLWAKSIGGIYRSNATSVCTDLNNNIILTGYFQSPTITFGSINLINNTGSDDVFVVKYDSDGNVLWAKSAGNYENDRATDVCSDTKGNIIVTGLFYYQINFDNFSLQNSDTINRSVDMFLVKYDANGNALWALNAGGTYNSGEVGRCVTTDQNDNVFVAGAFGGLDITIGATALTNTDNTETTTDIFIAKFDSAGNSLWAKSGRGNFMDYVNSISTDLSGNVFLTGEFESYCLRIGTDSLINSDIFSYSTDIYTVKLDSAGNSLWMKNPSGGGDKGNGICTDANGNAFVTGEDVGNIFVTKYDNMGNDIWSKNEYGTNRFGFSVCIDPSGNLFVGGSFRDQFCTLDSTTLINAGGASEELFIAKLDQCEFSSSNITQTFCNSVTINSQIYTTSGIYYQIIPNTIGCDSLLALQLTINNIDVSTTIEDTTISANLSGATYQWLDCNNSYMIISGETNQTLSPGINGDYAVEITSNGCTDTSDCVNMINLNTSAIDFLNSKISISPNPVIDKLIVRLSNDNVPTSANISIYNLLGEEIYSTRINGKQETIYSNFSSGIYFIKINFKDNKFIEKFVVQ